MVDGAARTDRLATIERSFGPAGRDVGWLWVEERRDGDDLVLRAVLPNIDPDDDVEIYLGEGIVHIEAHCDKNWQERVGHRPGFPYGSFARNVAVPLGTDEGSVKATYTDDLLEVRVRVEPARRERVKRIPVTGARDDHEEGCPSQARPPEHRIGPERTIYDLLAITE